jgi:ABC-type phosphate transport system substrate-binding protein
MRALVRCCLLLGSLASSPVLLCAEGDVVAIVSAKSEVTALTPAQVADIFLGRVSRFPSGGKAVALDLPEGSATRDNFYAQFASKSPAQVKAHWSKIIFTGRGQPPEALPDGPQALERVARDPSAIAYVDRRLVDDRVRVVSP